MGKPAPGYDLKVGGDEIFVFSLRQTLSYAAFECLEFVGATEQYFPFVLFVMMTR